MVRSSSGLRVYQKDPQQLPRTSRHTRIVWSAAACLSGHAATQKLT